jgi:hypothetical protein
VDVRVTVAVFVRVVVAVSVRDAVVVAVEVLVEVPTTVIVGDEARAVEEPVGVTVSVRLMVLVPKTPIGMIVAVPVETA